MADKRRKDMEWWVTDDEGKCLGVDHAQLAVLMDFRDELKRLNTLLHCGNAVDIPRILRRISRNTAKPRQQKKC